jgi:hypothetical protein
MATRFVRIDLSDEARDYRPLAIEPGVPMLDRSNANSKILFRWVGGLAAEPVWDGDSVNFFVRDNRGGRLEEVLCQPASEHELRTLLRDELGLLKDRLEKARAETPTERTFRKVLLRTFHELIENPGRTDLDSYFFRYRDLENRWRLVWCWGYQRIDQEPAPAVVCTEPECALLFVRRPGKSPKCPGCASTLQYRRPVRKGSKRRRSLWVALLLLLLAAGLLGWKYRPERLVVVPNHLIGPVGSRFEIKVLKAGLFSKEDVTGHAVGIVMDPAVARFDQLTGMTRLVGPGGTNIRFQMGPLQSEVSLEATADPNPEKITIEPRDVDLAPGSTARLKLIGHYKDGATADLTAAAEWKPQNDKIVFAMGGFLEGLAPGASTVSASYRATPESPYLDAAANVNVAKVEVKSLEIGIAPAPVGVGRGSRLRIDAVGPDGRHYSLLESSQLKTEVGPSYLASVHGGSLRGDRVGHGTLVASLGDGLKAERPFTVAAIPGARRLEVYPKTLPLLVGEIADLTIVSPSTTPVRISSFKPGIVEVTASNRLVGRAEGTTEVEVAQGSQKSTVEVSVAKAEFAAIAIDPASVVVPVDDVAYPRVVARVKGDQTGRWVELAPDRLACDKAPSPRYADFNVRRMEFRGVMPTDPKSPQTLAMRHAALAAKAPVAVVVMPLRLELTPPGPVDLPLGQMMRLQGWAHYSGGRLVAVPGERMKWQTDHAAHPAPGLELRGDKVAALKAGGGPLPVSATYFDKPSNAVVFKSVAADPNLTLRLDVDRTIRLAGEPGQLALEATCPRGDVELVPEMGSFSSAEAAVIKVDAKHGDFHAGAPGEATVTGSHAAAKKPATLKLTVHDPATARLVFDPAAARLAVGEQAALPLFLEVQAQGKTQRAAMEGPGIAYAIAQPSAVQWSPPLLVGLSAAKPFPLTAGYPPYLKGTATAQVEVLPAVEPAGLRVVAVPAAAALAPGQGVSLVVQQQTPGAEQWTEVRPDLVSWTAPAEVIWEPATESLPPALTVPQDAKGEIQLRAEVAGKEAVATFSVKPQGPDAADAAARLLALRQSGGQYLPVGGQQRYTIMVDKDGHQEPATDVRWPGDFENRYVKWQAPVLTAKEAGTVQWLRADVAGRTVLLHTTTYAPGRFVVEPPVNPDAPIEVLILSDQGDTVRFPVGAQFDDFRVQARYRDGYTRLVTKKALLTTREPPPSAPLTASNGHLIGVHPGETSVAAEFEGVHTKKSLGVTVTQGIDADEIRVVPTPIILLRGETVALGVIGYKAGKSIGNITGLANVTWLSDSPQTARVDGHALIAVKLGQANIVASMGSLHSPPAKVSVVDSVAESLRVAPKSLQLVVGESARIGTELIVQRGDPDTGMDVSEMCSVRSLRPDCVRYVPETRSLVGVAPGQSQVAITLGDKLVNVPVEVVSAGVKGKPLEGDIRIEPSGLILARGQAEALRVYVDLTDHTGAAKLTSSDPKVVAIQGDMVCALAPGKAEITASFPDTPQTGRAYVTVNNEELTEVYADPMWLEVGGATRMPVLGKAPCGIHELFPQPDLTLSAGGKSPGAIALTGGHWVKGVAVGEATVELDWRQGKLKGQAAVTVTKNPWTDLQIRPAQTTINKGQALTYEVTANKGGQVRVLTPEDGVQLAVSDANVAQVLDGVNVGGKQEGRTTVLAKLGPLSAEATLDVTAGSAVSTGVLVDGGVVTQPPDVIVTGDGDRVFRHGTTIVETLPGVKVEQFDRTAAHLVVTPEPLVLWIGETGKLGSVRLDTGGGQPSIPVEYKVTAPEGQTVVKVEGDKIHGLAQGNSHLTVTATDPQFQGLSADVAVQVDNADKLAVEPTEMTLQVGETTPPVTVTAKGADGTSYQVPATLESQDEKVLVAAADQPGRFVAKAMGSTQLKAGFRGVDLFATVTVTGKRFVEVKTTPNMAEKDFDVTVEVLAAAAEGPLEYRVYVEGQPAPDAWTPNEPQGESRHVVLHSPRMTYGPPGTLYHLMIEARKAADEAPQQYPVTLRAAVTIVREENK